MLFALLLLHLQSASPAPPGRLVDAGGHRLHLHCTGKGRPTVVIETGLGDFSSDWVLVQQRVATFTRVCTYDRAGYAWSEAGPLPRTFDQINYELRKALANAGEPGPYVLVGHSYGGGPVRQFAIAHRADVAGLVFVDIVGEYQYVSMGRHAGRIGDDAKGRQIPPPRDGRGEQRTGAEPTGAPIDPGPIEPPYDRLPRHEQAMHAWASTQPELGRAEDSQREWSTEYFARWMASSRKGSLGDIPLIVLTRKVGGYRTNMDRPAEELERARLDAQLVLTELSTAGKQRLVDAGHNMHLETPDIVVEAIRDVLAAKR
jgi:pimeloyl-ACP methyl ester carboxylesterase